MASLEFSIKMKLHLLKNFFFIVGNTHIDEHDVNEFNSMHVDTNLQQSDNVTFAQSSTVTNFNINCDDAAIISFIVNMLVDSTHNTINSDTCQTGMYIISFICDYDRVELTS